MTPPAPRLKNVKKKLHFSCRMASLIHNVKVTQRKSIKNGRKNIESFESLSIGNSMSSLHQDHKNNTTKSIKNWPRDIESLEILGTWNSPLSIKT